MATPMEEVLDRHFLQPLRDAIASSFEGNCFRPQRLFERWFRERGVAYFFLFKKNLSCTNLQFAELLALLRVHTSDPLKRRRELHFVTLAQFLTEIGDTVQDLQLSIPTPSLLVAAFVRLYSDLLWSMVVVEPFYGSCTAFFPGHLSLDLFRACSESGYIHSCGLNVYTRSLDEADQNGLITAVESHLAKTPTALKSFFAVYAHEDFTQYDRDDAADLRDGLDDVKIFVEKYYLSDNRFVSVLQQIQARLGGRITIPAPGDYRTERQAARRKGEIDTSHTVWLIIDRALTDDPPFRGDDRFLVCYDQFYRNENPFHIFDENKPAWVSHTTLPHTLAAAMVNVTRPWWPKERQVNVSDPFSGTGTIWLECTKFQNVHPRCADLEPITLLLAEDNLRFFASSLGDLRTVQTSLKAIVTELKTLRAPERIASRATRDGESDYQAAIDLFERLAHSPTSASFTVPEDVIDLLRGRSFLCRLLFYLALRTYVRHFAAFSRGSEEWTKAYLTELLTLMRQTDLLCELKDQETSNVLEARDAFSKFVGSYSISSAVSTQRLAGTLLSQNVWPGRRDARERLVPPVDVIVTDPPYGFNTENDYAELAVLYSEAIRAMIAGLEDGGQLVLCLADKSHTGKHIAAFSAKAWVTQQILAESQALGLEAIVEAQVMPNPGRLFRPPYYWESERALRRAILHFRFRRRPITPSS